MSDVEDWTPVKPVTPKVKNICIEVQPRIEEMAEKSFAVYVPVSFSSQQKAGTNYVVKVDVGGDECVHGMIFQALLQSGAELIVHKIQYPKSFTDPLIPF